VRRRYYSAKRRAIMKRGDVIRHLDIFERDEWICGICKELIDKYLRGDAWMRATLDHIIPLCKGGEHVFENVQAAHWRCNMLKGDQLTLSSTPSTMEA
jgi:5-methylcytosine-specific restriction endonuclease McrA